MEIVLHFYITSYAIENSPILWYNGIALYLIVYIVLSQKCRMWPYIYLFFVLIIR